MRLCYSGVLSLLAGPWLSGRRKPDCPIVFFGHGPLVEMRLFCVLLFGVLFFSAWVFSFRRFSGGGLLNYFQGSLLDYLQ